MKIVLIVYNVGGFGENTSYDELEVENTYQRWDRLNAAKLTILSLFTVVLTTCIFVVTTPAILTQTAIFL